MWCVFLRSARAAKNSIKPGGARVFMAQSVETPYMRRPKSIPLIAVNATDSGRASASSAYNPHASNVIPSLPTQRWGAHSGRHGSVLEQMSCAHAARCSARNCAGVHASSPRVSPQKNCSQSSSVPRYSTVAGDRDGDSAADTADAQ